MGLEWQDIDYDAKTIEIKQASQYLPGKGVFLKSPKNESSKRIISVNEALLAQIKAYKEEQQQKGFLCGDNTGYLLHGMESQCIPAQWQNGFLNSWPSIIFPD